MQEMMNNDDEKWGLKRRPKFVRNEENNVCYENTFI